MAAMVGGQVIIDVLQFKMFILMELDLYSTFLVFRPLKAL